MTPQIQLNNLVFPLLTDQPVRHLWCHGHTGWRKTALIREMANKIKEEHQYPIRVIHPSDEYPDMPLYTQADEITSLLKTLPEIPQLVIIDNIEYLHEEALSLFHQILSTINKTIFFIVSHRPPTNSELSFCHTTLQTSF